MKRFGLALLAGLVLVLGVAVVPAGAAQVSGPPDGAGKYAYCNAVADKVGAGTPHAGYWRFSMSCNRGAEAYYSLRITWATGYNPTGFGYPATYGGFNRSLQLTQDTPQRSAYIPFSNTSGTFGQFSSQQWTEPGNTSYEICTGPLVGGNASGTCRAVAVNLTVDDVVNDSSTDSMTPPWPVTFFAGGAGSAPPAAAPIGGPTYRCMRTLENVGGDWVVNLDVEGPFGLDPAADPETLSESWSGGWLTTPSTGRTATLTLPAQAPPGGWVLTFTGEYELDETQFWAVEPDPVRDALNGTVVWTPPSVIEQFWTARSFWDGLRLGGPNVTDVWRFTDSASVQHEAVLYRTGEDGDYGVKVDGVDYGAVFVNFIHGGVAGGATTGATFARRGGFSNVGGGDFGPGDFEVGGGDFGDATQGPAGIRASCSILVDLAQPNTGAQSTTPGEGTAPPATEGGSGCSAGALGNVPLLGGIFDATARLACTMGDLFGKLGRLIIQLFIPENGVPWQTLTDGISSKFPLNLIGGVGSFVTTMSTASTTGLEEGDACPVLGFGSVIKIPGSGADTEPLNIRLPTPSDSGCPGLGGGARTDRDNSVGDLFGWRSFASAVFLVGLWLAVILKIIRAFSPAAETGLVEGG